MKTPRPFLKWAGGKRQLLPQLLQLVPASFNDYHEPFVGGGALFFALAQSLRRVRATIHDANARLIRAYRAIQEDVEAVIALLASYPHERAFYEETRRRDVDLANDVEMAAWMIYLNKTCYNGLYRVNADGHFNVPFGNYKNPTICDAENLRACAKALMDVELHWADFSYVVQQARKGDLVYFDPPYVPLSVTSAFTSYTAGGFGPADQKRLRNVARQLKRRGVHVLLSNSDTPQVRELYAQGFHRRRVQATRTISSKADRRGKIDELIIW